ncbi:MAG: HepT-like ribonuclease domain-containing protein [Terriglobia bacterium]
MKDDAAYLRHIMECIRRIAEDVVDGRERFMHAHTLQDAVLRNLQTMSESTQLLSDSLKATHPEIEWRRIAAFRNLLVHNYLGVDLERVWDIVQRDVPPLKRAVEAMLQDTERI